MPSYYPEGNTSLSTDGELRALNKLVSLGASSGSTTLHGNGDPNGSVSGAQGQLYAQDDNPGVIWINQNGGTVWAINA